MIIIPHFCFSSPSYQPCIIDLQCQLQISDVWCSWNSSSSLSIDLMILSPRILCSTILSRIFLSRCKILRMIYLSLSLSSLKSSAALAHPNDKFRLSTQIHTAPHNEALSTSTSSSPLLLGIFLMQLSQLCSFC